MAVKLTAEEIQILRRAKELIVKGWTRDASARTRHGTAVASNSLHAARFCLLGAIQHASFDLSPYGGQVIYDHCINHVKGIIFAATAQTSSCVDYNDTYAKGKQDVIKLLDRAIAEAA